MSHKMHCFFHDFGKKKVKLRESFWLECQLRHCPLLSISYCWAQCYPAVLNSCYVPPVLWRLGTWSADLSGNPLIPSPPLWDRATQSPWHLVIFLATIQWYNLSQVHQFKYVIYLPWLCNYTSDKSICKMVCDKLQLTVSHSCPPCPP